METFTDPRDNNVYKIVKIGKLLWFAENLRYQGVPHHFPNRDSDNLQKYGCLYTWEHAIEACPPDWRLPTANEFYQLLFVTDAGSNSSSIRSSSWENGSDASGFGVLPTGYRGYLGCFYNFGSDASFWSATPGSNDDAYSLNVYSDNVYMRNHYINCAFSVRCVKEV